ncbi:MAG: RnfABCDGE type electron transport complex subunit G [Candidatus Omnitrophica bacterium]|nr:RnfABCDGE type electron transport complex subunit G [Candidatus Omnitrophota bacterium]
MKEIVRITSVLTLVCLICALLLSVVYGLANKKIEINKEKRIEKALTTLAPQAAKVEEATIKEETIYKLFDEKENLIGYGFTASGEGYQGKIKMLVVSDKYLEHLKGIEVVESLETPGLGAKIQEDPFKDQFKNLDIREEMTCVKGDTERDGQIKAITGATVSSRAVVNILSKRLEEIKELINEN